MRWRRMSVEVGTRRVVRAFLWRPLTINGETRWLEVAAWVERFDFNYGGGFTEWTRLNWEDPAA